MTNVWLPNEVKGEDLEAACLTVAGELEYQTDKKDNFEEEYSLGPFMRERSYKSTEIILTRDKTPFFKVSNIKRERNVKPFLIDQIDNTPYEVIEQYLERVSKKLFPDASYGSSQGGIGPDL